MTNRNNILIVKDALNPRILKDLASKHEGGETDQHQETITGGQAENNPNVQQATEKLNDALKSNVISKLC